MVIIVYAMKGVTLMPEQKKISPLLPAQDWSAVDSGTMLLWRGRAYRLTVTRSLRKPALVPDGEELRLNIYQADDRPVAAWLAYWYRVKAAELIHQRANYWSRLMDEPFGSLTIREQRSRWGSCSSLRNLNFNWRLLMAPDEVIDYVVIHEIAHLKELNHSPAFWQIVETYDAAYKEHRQWLKEHGLELFAALPSPVRRRR